MILKCCSRCNNLFQTNSKRKDRRCPSCINFYATQARQKRKEGYTYVYYLPEEHYVGITNHMTNRMSYHKSHGRLINDYEIIAKFERMVDAMWFETMLHQRHYNGGRSQ